MLDQFGGGREAFDDFDQVNASTFEQSGQVKTVVESYGLAFEQAAWGSLISDLHFAVRVGRWNWGQKHQVIGRESDALRSGSGIQGSEQKRATGVSSVHVVILIGDKVQ
ncbi:hypothetical protein D3C84_311730 [compost metagenome]